MHRWSFWIASAGIVGALIVGCGGDDDDAPAPATAGKPSSGGMAGSTASGGKSGSGGTSAMAGGGGQASQQIEIEGTWVSNQFGSTETDVIDDTTWSTQYGDSAATVSNIVEFSNTERYAIRKAPNDPTAFHPGTFDRVVWTKPAGDVIYYCTVLYGCASADLTETGDGAGGAGSAGAGAGGASDEGLCVPSVVDDSDPEHSGCGAFAWTKLTRQ